MDFFWSGKVMEIMEKSWKVLMVMEKSWRADLIRAHQSQVSNQLEHRSVFVSSRKLRKSVTV